MTWTQIENRLIDFYVHEWLGIPRPVPGPLALSRPMAEPVKIKESAGMYLENPDTNTWVFTINRPPVQERNPVLTNEDILLLKKRGFKNHTLNAKAKRVWAAGMTAPEGAHELSISPDYAKKLWGTFSTAENRVQNRAKSNLHALTGQ